MNSYTDKSKNNVIRTANVGAGQNATAQLRRNDTGLPNNLKSGIENLSGHSMDDVKVHYNSAQPAQLSAHAFAQGNQIHLGPGQEKHLPHEAWHVVQQKQGRVRPTIQLKSNVPINDDVGLEKEADVMGEKALQLKTEQSAVQLKSSSGIQQVVIQGFWPFTGPSLFSMIFGNGEANQPQQAPQQQPQQVPTPRMTHRELLRLANREANRRRDEERRVRNQRLNNLPGELRARLVASETRFEQAAQLLPAAIRNPWTGEAPAIVEDGIYPLVHSLPVRFPNEHAADTLETGTERIEEQARTYRIYVERIAPALITPAAYYQMHHAVLSVALRHDFQGICLSIERGEGTADSIIGRAVEFVKRAQAETALDSAALFHMMQHNPGQARQVVENYFALGRLRIGKNRSFYASEHDAPAGRFGGEWALLSNDPNLGDIAKKWVFHAHCQAQGNVAAHDYQGFTLVAAVGASHIKREADRMANGLSITVNLPNLYAGVAASSQDRFERWSQTPLGREALRKQRRG